MASNLMNHIQQHIDSHRTGGQHWPDAATHAIKFNRFIDGKWDKTSSMEFFLSREELMERIAEWSYTGQRVAYLAYEWDLGPNPMTGVYNESWELYPTKAERDERR